MFPEERCFHCRRITTDYNYIGSKWDRDIFVCDKCYFEFGYDEDEDDYIYEKYYAEKNNEDYYKVKKRIFDYMTNVEPPKPREKTKEEIEQEEQRRKEEEHRRMIEEQRKKEEEEKRKREEEIKERQERKQKRERILAQVNQLIGMSHIKTNIESWLIRLEGAEMLKKNSHIKIDMPPSNMVLTGNPGVGKTTLARMLTKILFESGFIKENKLIEVKAEDLVAEYVGHTAQKTKNEVEKAKGGVLFLDEAYRLTTGFSSNRDKGSFGLEALETIMGYMESNDVVFIFAGYEDKMQEFIDANEGFRSRIKEFFRLKDYTLEELTQIALKTLSSKGYKTDLIADILSSSIKTRLQQGILKGNGRTIHQFADKIVENHMIRLTKEENIEDYHTVLIEDVEKAFKKNDENQEGLKQIFNDAKGQINELIGLLQVKKEVERIGNFQYIQQRRKDLGLKVETKSHHMLFLGNPGTGKTTLARLIGQLFRGAGVLSNGHFVEATKDMLTSGDSISKTVKSLVDKAIGGILFIDEAYMLANDGKGKEALDSLIPLMENRREEFICILAGYEEDMNFLFKLNKGLASRIPYHFTFEDYSSEELFEMAISKIAKEGYQLENGADITLKTVIESSKKNHQTDGNGRWVRNLFEQFIIVQSARLVSFEEIGNMLEIEDFNTLVSDDIQAAHKNMLSLLVRTESKENKNHPFAEMITALEGTKKDKAYA